MATVDMGFENVANVLDLSGVTYWRLFDQSEWIKAPGGSYRINEDEWYDPDAKLTYRSLRGQIDNVLESGPLIYWGDFHHLAPYHRAVASVLYRDLGACATLDDAQDLVASHLLLRGRSRSRVHGVASFGSTLLLNSPDDYAGTYGKDLREFVMMATEVHMRDGYSESVVRDIDDGPTSAWRGSDCAFLAPKPAPGAREETMSVFFGRSALMPEQLAWFGARLSRLLGLAPQWIDWGREPAFWPMGDRRRFRLAWPALEHRTVHPTPGDRFTTYKQVLVQNLRPHSDVQPTAAELLEQIASSSLVLTDTYHLALNAWRIGTPAVCILDDPAGHWNVNSGSLGSHRDKRWDLYSSLDALPFTVHAAQLTAGAIRKSAAQLADAVADEQLGRVIESRVADAVRRARTGAIATISRLIESSIA